MKSRYNLPWSDTSRFCQTGYSANTIFPTEGNYEYSEVFNEDLARANARELHHQEFLDEQRHDAEQEAYYEADTYYNE